jgi:hypothetical protein
VQKAFADRAALMAVFEEKTLAERIAYEESAVAMSEATRFGTERDEANAGALAKVEAENEILERISALRAQAAKIAEEKSELLLTISFKAAAQTAAFGRAKTLDTDDIRKGSVKRILSKADRG